jgi:hypothetical protein
VIKKIKLLSRLCKAHSRTSFRLFEKRTSRSELLVRCCFMLRVRAYNKISHRMCHRGSFRAINATIEKTKNKGPSKSTDSTQLNSTQLNVAYVTEDLFEQSTLLLTKRQTYSVTFAEAPQQLTASCPNADSGAPIAKKNENRSIVECVAKDKRELCGAPQSASCSVCVATQGCIPQRLFAETHLSVHTYHLIAQHVKSNQECPLALEHDIGGTIMLQYNRATKYIDESFGDFVKNKRSYSRPT